jgi:nickel transport protein
MRLLLSALLIALASMGPAHAHKLKVFATVEGGTISGYGYFVGGGRPQGTTVIINDATAREVYRGATDRDGRFSFLPAGPSDFTVIIDTREGHVAQTVLTAERFGATGPRPQPAAPAEAHATKSAPPGSGEAEAERRMEAVVARQVRPLLERIEALDARLRLADIVSGVCMILGLAGIGLWALGRTSRHTWPPEA